MDKIKYTDDFGRTFASLRVSLTQACNFQCSYCVPAGLHLKKLPDELNASSLFCLTESLVKVANIQKLRLTGGEPLLYANLESFVELLKKLQLKDKSITTNGILLEKHLDLLWESGFKRLNLSLDSLEEKSFTQMSKRKGLKKVLQAIEKALQKGFSIKINVVPMKLLNDNQILPLLDFCLENKIECRYIELMKMGHLGPVFNKYFISMEQILAEIKTKYKIKKATAPLDSVAQRFEIVNKGFFGIIPNLSAPFCSNCNRLRLTSDGRVYGCISNTKNHSIKHLLDCSAETRQQELMKILPEAMKSKQKVFVGAETYMQQIGG